MQPSAKTPFSGVGEKDVYNIAAPFIYQGQPTIAGRVESRDEELAEIVLFSEAEDGAWHPIDGAPTFPGLQDPAITQIDGRNLLGGVRFPVAIGDDTHAWQMEFYLEQKDGSFEKAFSGPPKMKDIRLAQLPSGDIVVMTRPQGERGGRGKIGYLIVDSLAAITDEAIKNAPLFDQCPAEEWVGANEVHILDTGQLGVLGHIAHFDGQGNRHYYAMAFSFDPSTGECSPHQIIAKREDFPPGDSKRPDLVDVIFSGGLIRHDDGRATLYAGLSDAEAGWVEISDPFVS